MSKKRRSHTLAPGHNVRGKRNAASTPLGECVSPCAIEFESPLAGCDDQVKESEKIKERMHYVAIFENRPDRRVGIAAIDASSLKVVIQEFTGTLPLNFDLHWSLIQSFRYINLYVHNTLTELF